MIIFHLLLELQYFQQHDKTNLFRWNNLPYFGFSVGQLQIQVNHVFRTWKNQQELVTLQYPLLLSNISLKWLKLEFLINLYQHSEEIIIIILFSWFIVFNCLTSLLWMVVQYGLMLFLFFEMNKEMHYN